MSIAITYFVTYILEGFIAFYFFEKIFMKKHDAYKSIVAVVILYLFQFFTSQLEIPVLNLVLFLLCNFIYAKLFYIIKNAMAVFCSLLMTFIMAITEIITGSLIGSLYSNFDVADLKHAEFVLYFILSKTMYLLFVFVAMKIITANRSQYENHITVIAPIVVLVSAIIITVINFYISKRIKLPLWGEKLLAGISIFVLFISVVSIWLYEYSIGKSEKIANLLLAIQAEQDSIHMNNRMEELYENQQILVHDVKKHLGVIRSCMEQKEYGEVNRYIDGLLNMPAFSRGVNYSKSKRLNVLIGRYVEICQNENIDIGVDIQSENIDYIRPEDMTALFSNLLDNAIEAANGENGFVELIVREDDNILSIRITNTCEFAPEILPNGNFQTRKQDKQNHGFGMLSIKRVIQKYKGDMVHYYDELDNVFKVIVKMTIKGE